MPIIDRFEGDTALWEGGSAPRSILPMAAREGDVIKEDGSGGYYIDITETNQLKAAMSERLNALFKGENM